MSVEFRHGTLCERLLPGEKLPLLRVMRGCGIKEIPPHPSLRATFSPRRRLAFVLLQQFDKSKFEKDRSNRLLGNYFCPLLFV